MSERQKKLIGLEAEDSGPVTCLGHTFKNDDERRGYFLERLREKLRDPEFRKTEGFPLGADEDILALSDPPYYTACPNPFLAEFVKLYGNPYDPAVEYRREPFSTDVSEGKNDPVYNAHSYHTKVPARAILRYVLHYTSPGDVILDGFCGTGMVGVSCLLAECADEELKIQIGSNIPEAKWGLRYSLLVDLSPAATCIANSYNDPIPVNIFRMTAQNLVNQTIKPLQWMFQTLDGQDIFYFEHALRIHF